MKRSDEQIKKTKIEKSVALFNLDKGATNGFVKFVKILTSKRILNF